MHDLQQLRDHVETDLRARLQLTSIHSSTLVAAMQYSVCGPAKRVRALLVYATALGLGAELTKATAPAAAIEFIHAYSLVHDDLPDMDDADLRRGSPSCHKKFSPTIAILAGDALQTLAFSTLLEANELTHRQRINCATLLADASGWRNMVGGQAMDMELMHHTVDNVQELYNMHEGKTGALFRAAVQMGTVVAGFPPHTSLFRTMSNFGTKIGIAFQLTDDLLDATIASEQLGKPAGADRAAGKKNAVSFLGERETRNQASQYLTAAFTDLDSIQGDMTILQTLAQGCVHRRH